MRANPSVLSNKKIIKIVGDCSLKYTHYWEETLEIITLHTNSSLLPQPISANRKQTKHKKWVKKSSICKITTIIVEPFIDAATMDLTFRNPSYKL